MNSVIVNSDIFSPILSGEIKLPRAVKLSSEGEKIPMEIRHLEKFEKYSRIEGLIEIGGEPRFFSVNIVNGSEKSLLKIK